MWFLLILVLIALIACFVLGRQNRDQMKGVIIGLAALAIVLALVNLFRSCSGGSGVSTAQVDRFEQAVGYRLGQALAEDLPDGGPVLVVQWEHLDVDRMQELNEARLDGLKAGASGARFTWTTDGPRPEQDGEEALDSLMMIEDMGLTEDLFADLLARHEDVVAVVSFLTLQPDVIYGPQDRPPLYFVDFGMMQPLEFRDLGGAVGAVVQFREDADWRTKPGRGMSKEEVFELRYKLIRP